MDNFEAVPVLACTIEPEWYETDDKNPNQVQFGHVEPIRLTSI